MENNHLDALTGDLYIPRISSGEVSATFYSSDPSVLQTDGKVLRAMEDKMAVFTVMLSLGSQSLRRDFPVTIKQIDAETAVAQDLEALLYALRNSYNLSAVTGNLSIPEVGSYGSTITIESSNPSVISNRGVVTRGAEDQTVSLKISVDKDGQHREETITVTVRAVNTGLTPSSSGGGDSGSSRSYGTGTVSGMSGGSTGDNLLPNEPEKMQFTDLSEEHWAYEAMSALWEEGILRGTDAKHAEPERAVTREEFAKLLACVLDIRPKGGAVVFSDVPETRWSYQYIRTLASNGIVQGLPDGSFGADALVTRQDMAVMIYRGLAAAGIAPKETRGSAAFADSGEISEYAVEAIDALYQVGLIGGLSEDTFGPGMSATRAQAAQILYRILEMQ